MIDNRVADTPALGMTSLSLSLALSRSLSCKTINHQPVEALSLSRSLSLSLSRSLCLSLSPSLSLSLSPLAGLPPFRLARAMLDRLLRGARPGRLG